jgi:L-amino acid N-acyltransferase YncA
VRGVVHPAGEDADVVAIQRIYADAVLRSAASFEIEPPTLDEMRSRRRRVVDAGYPYLAADMAGALVGYCYAGPFRDRPAYRLTVESSVYVVATLQRRGVGRALMQRLIEDCKARGIPADGRGDRRQANEASIGLHEGLGFERVGVLAERRAEVRCLAGHHADAARARVRSDRVTLSRRAVQSALGRQNTPCGGASPSSDDRCM